MPDRIVDGVEDLVDNEVIGESRERFVTARHDRSVLCDPVRLFTLPVLAGARAWRVPLSFRVVLINACLAWCVFQEVNGVLMKDARNFFEGGRDFRTFPIGAYLWEGSRSRVFIGSNARLYSESSAPN